MLCLSKIRQPRGIEVLILVLVLKSVLKDVRKGEKADRSKIPISCFLYILNQCVLLGGCSSENLHDDNGGY